MTAFISRAEAGLRAPKSRSTNIRPAHVTAHYMGPSPWAGGKFDHSRCASIWRATQAYHMNSNGWADVAYTSAVCPHGYVYEGRGPGIRTAANGTNIGNDISYAVVYLAGVGDALTDAAKLAYLSEERRLGVPLNKVHSEWKPTACPGDPLRVWVKAGHPSPVPAPPPPVPVRPVLPPAEHPLVTIRKAIDAAKKHTLRRGDKGAHVAALQLLLWSKGAKQVKADGDFGPITDSVVRFFQKITGLQVDGIVGPKTWAMLDK